MKQVKQNDICSREAEAGLLGSMIILGNREPGRIGEVISKLDVEDFYLPEHEEIYRAICDIYSKTSKLDAVVLREKLKQGDELEPLGGVDVYVPKLVETLTSAANLDYFVEIVKRKAKNREVIKIGESIYEAALNSDQPDGKIERIQELSSSLTPIEITPDVYQVKDVTQDALEGLLEEKSGLSTGFSKMDWHLGGLRPGNLCIVAARPSMGKTAWAIDVALNVAREGKAIVIYSLEMTKEELVQRMICSIARVDAHKVRQQRYSPEDVTELARAADTLNKYNIHIKDISQLTPESFRVSLMTFKHRDGVDCAIVDYLQLMEAGGKKESRQQEITTISRQLKAAARGAEIPIIVLSQLNREVEHRMSHKPQLSDLRESGSIEQDADVGILLHRPDWYHKGEDDYNKTNTGIFQIAKSRNGPTGELELNFDEKYVSFGNLMERY
ncbi:MAG: replicative DNA helicase [Planctomycetes bacterium]|nr:replicative DNA helicase [Planctomycetota bacterium]